MMMTCAEIRQLRDRWETEARYAAAVGDQWTYSYRISGIGALDLVLGDIDTLVSERIPFV